jgi:tRNA(adenine34) deaminase
MCAGAIINARIPTVVYGAKDPKAGSVDSILKMYELPYNHKPEVVSGVLEAECSQVLRDFFRQLREKRR